MELPATVLRAILVYKPTMTPFKFYGYDSGGRLHLEPIRPGSDELPHFMKVEPAGRLVFHINPADIPEDERLYSHEQRREYQFATEVKDDKKFIKKNIAMGTVTVTLGRVQGVDGNDL
jgi:hypothetical protein